MSKGRLEAFSDGVLAIIITIMVLELRPPEEGTLAALRPLLPKLLSYVLSFVYLGIYWNNHHHLWHAVKTVNGSVLWANMHLLFWLSLIPFTTSWIGEHFSTTPVALYGCVLWFAGLAYYIMVRLLIVHHGSESFIATVIGRDEKGLRSLYIYSAAILLAFVSPALASGLYVAVAIMWLIPDRRIEDNLRK
jgi:uncharacterized membrane protein